MEHKPITQNLYFPSEYSMDNVNFALDCKLLKTTHYNGSIFVHKFSLPRVLLHGQTDTTEAEDRRFFMKVVDKSVRDTISSQK